MMRLQRLLEGLTVGVVFGLALLLVALYLNSGTDGQANSSLFSGTAADCVSWIERNMGASLLPFIAVSLCYVISLRRLRSALNTQNTGMAQLEHLSHCVDVWASVFFAIGVIWTAIGMRASLINGLGSFDPQTGSQQNAALLLRQLVDGGILVALSTTIVGGVGGYIMRLAKTLLVGQKLLDRQHRCSAGWVSAIQDRLDSIDGQVARARAESLARPRQSQ